MNSSVNAKVVLAAANKSDRESIYAIRHAIYAEELGQHKVNGTGHLHDDLDLCNHYIVARKQHKVIGFISITSPDAGRYSADKYFDRSAIPFSFDAHVYEIRILSVIKAHRNSSLAYLLMYAAMRWIEAHGGKNIIAICRSSLLGMYVKAGLVPLPHTVKAGNVTYVLSIASIAHLNALVQKQMEKFKLLRTKVEWKLPYSFFAPSPCYHGGASFTAIGEDLQTLEKRNVVINADVLDAWFPPSPKVIAALHNNLAWLLQTSPPTHCTGLIKVIAAVRGIEEASILPGAGSSDLIFLALQHFLARASKVLIIDPCYGEYRHVLDHIIQCSVTTFPLRREEGFAVNTAALLEEILKGYDMVILVNPNSPTGLHIAKTKMEEMLLQVPSATLVWIDETYIEYQGTTASLEQFATRRQNVIICKSMSKAYALSGARAGYLCCAPHLIETLKLLTPPWAISLPGQLAAVTALQDESYYHKKYNETHLLREKMRLDLLNIGMPEVIPGVANFLLCYLPAGITVMDFMEDCKAFNLYLRDVSAMGTTLGNGALRIAVKDEKTNERMLAIMRRVLAEAKTKRLTEHITLQD